MNEEDLDQQISPSNPRADLLHRAYLDSKPEESHKIQPQVPQNTPTRPLSSHHKSSKTSLTLLDLGLEGLNAHYQG